ncbi:MAG: YqaJ viral recombinase family protein [Firmicutes bacterium]|nr:YqaJ viral recombinase family protein [Bacillota bacterium]
MAAPILLCDTAGMTRERWLDCRMHGPAGTIPYTLGGSDVSVVLSSSPWTTPLELWRIKKGLMKPNDGANATAKEMGHLMEPIVALCYAKMTGNTIIEDTGLYQHADYPWALANLDYRLEEGGMQGVLECKTTTYHKAGDWTDDQIPYYYELQVRFYLAVMDLDFADIACMWGFNPETDMAIRRVNRDRAIEAYIFELLDAFIASLHGNTPPDMSGVKPELAMAALARVYGASQAGLPTLEFGARQEKDIRRLAELQEDMTTLRDQLAAKEREVTAHSVRIAEVMKTHEHGVLELPGKHYKVDFVTRVTRRPDSKALKAKYPAAYADVLKASESRKIKITVEPT